MTVVEVEVTQNGNQKKPKPEPEAQRTMSKYIPRGIPQKTFDKVCMVLAEVLGTAALLFFGCMSTVPIQGQVISIAPPITFGLTVMMIVQMFGHISLAILNPAVAIIAVVFEFISIKMAIVYTMAEIVGAIIGYGLLQYLSPAELFSGENFICMALPHNISATQAFFIEFFLTCALSALICGLWDPRNRSHSDSLPLRIGFGIVALSIAGGPYTGASMNPVRALAPALWNWHWEHHWLYWVSAPAASFLTSTFYKIIFFRDVLQEKKPEQEALDQAKGKNEGQM